MCELSGKISVGRFVREADFLALKRHRDDLLGVIKDMKASYESEIQSLTLKLGDKTESDKD